MLYIKILDILHGLASCVYKLKGRHQSKLNIIFKYIILLLLNGIVERLILNKKHRVIRTCLEASPAILKYTKHVSKHV